MYWDPSRQCHFLAALTVVDIFNHHKIHTPNKVHFRYSRVNKNSLLPQWSVCSFKRVILHVMLASKNASAHAILLSSATIFRLGQFRRCRRWTHYIQVCYQGYTVLFIIKVLLKFTTIWMKCVQVEKTVDKIRQACQTTNKRLAASMQGTGMDLDKRLVRTSTMICH